MVRDAIFGRFVGGRLCLDFVNTVKSRAVQRVKGTGPEGAERVDGERLTSYGDLLRWATLTSALSDRQARALARRAAAHPADAASVLKRGVAVREAMYRLFTAAIAAAPARAEDLAALNHELQIARAHEQLVASAGFRWEWDNATDALDRALWPIVRSAADLLTGPALDRVGQCPGPECGWLFLDTSRARRRQWCDMADCGNLAKVQRFRKRQRRLARTSRTGRHSS